MNPLLITGFGTPINVDKRKLIITNSHNFKIPAVLLMTTIIAMLSSVFVFDMANAEPNDLDEIADKIQSDSRFEEFPPHVLDAIRAGEFDEYSILMVISKAPQDVGSYGSRTNVAKLTEIIENEMGLEIGGSGGAHIGILAPVEVLVEFAKYPYVERIIGNDYGMKYVNEMKTQGVIKFSYEDKIYDVLYNSTNVEIKGYTKFGIGFLPLENNGTIDVTYPRDLTDAIRNIYDYSNATLTSLIIDEKRAELSNYDILEANDNYTKIQWKHTGVLQPGGILFFGNARTTGSNPTTDDIQNDSPDKLPKWIKNNAGWWASDQINDDSFIMGIGYLIKNEIIMTDNKKEGTEIGTDDTRETVIPKWIKNNAGWWAEGKLTDSEFMTGMGYLVEKGIIII